MKITVIGCGRWGTFIAWYLNKIGHDVTLYGKENSTHFKQLVSERKNSYLTLSDSMKLSSTLEKVLEADIIVISINSQGLRALMQELSPYNLKDKTFILCMKGIEIETGKRLSVVVRENMDKSNKIAVWIGPGHVEEFVKGVPNCMVIDSLDHHVKELLIKNFSSELIRFYYGKDLLGNEIGAASKNVIGIAAGVLDGLGLSSLKGALMSRGTREIARLIKAMGGNELSAYGLCHLGDYEATVFSKYSHNRKFGESLVKGISYDDLAEGYYTAKALKKLSVEYDVELPICNAVYKVLYENKEVKEVINELFERSLKSEF
ncbi:TPA: NAD(P)H-dependent glycerol-3-phosphate dehydrogenase [bacterium]|nr:NAD(P)H-dependent glycerol-3-phosphate dehydrogenase [bacterium]